MQNEPSIPVYSYNEILGQMQKYVVLPWIHKSGHVKYVWGLFDCITGIGPTNSWRTIYLRHVDDFLYQNNRFLHSDSNCFISTSPTDAPCRNLVSNEIVDHSYVVGAEPVGATRTASSFSTLHLASMNWGKTTARRDKKHLHFIKSFYRNA